MLQTVDQEVQAALQAVNDPEYPTVSIVDLGLVASVQLLDGKATVGLIPTFSGCPALRFIASDVEQAVAGVPGVTGCTVEWLSHPVWSTERITPAGQAALSQEFTVVLRRKDGTLLCPVCGSNTVADTSMAGPTRCRSLAWCEDCRNPVEVMR